MVSIDNSLRKQGEEKKLDILFNISFLLNIIEF